MGGMACEVDGEKVEGLTTGSRMSWHHMGQISTHGQTHR